MRSSCVLSATRNRSCAVVCGNRACCRLCLNAHRCLRMYCLSSTSSAPHSTIRSEAEQTPTPHSSVSQMTFSMRLDESSISTTILSTLLWAHMFVPISSYPTYPVSNNPCLQRWLPTMSAPRKTSRHRPQHPGGAYVRTAQLRSA